MSTYAFTSILARRFSFLNIAQLSRNCDLHLDPGLDYNLSENDNGAEGAAAYC